MKTAPLTETISIRVTKAEKQIISDRAYHLRTSVNALFRPLVKKLAKETP